MEEPVSAGCATAVRTGVQSLQMNPNTVYTAHSGGEGGRGGAGAGKLTAPGRGEKTRAAEVLPSFLAKWNSCCFSSHNH